MVVALSDFMCVEIAMKLSVPSFISQNKNGLWVLQQLPPTFIPHFSDLNVRGHNARLFWAETCLFLIEMAQVIKAVVSIEIVSTLCK